ncbi:cephalosporin-C deacetylase [Lentzea waywayandensis]|uniref:Cephalosporin-C deacetylase n=1 Tax=Lentzea waywayandensis TaxID=84724 RepID=A0A1I6F8R8_9PSEU|nr:acetylxylan esterase [Lentzea waywayandensis]SFR26167.1 cephalosporin-C deacetylase [Lentzea waywayandensis]
MLTDLGLDELWEYRSSYARPDDFDSFWDSTLAEARAIDLDVEAVPVDTPLKTLDVYDVSFAGFGGDRIHAWLRTPQGQSGLPAVVQYHGYGGNRGSAVENLTWASAGFAHLQVEVREQRGGGGFLTRGIADRSTYFYRRVFTDAVRAVDAVRALGSADVAVIGNSQGGGIALAVAGLVSDLAAVHSQAPFLCDFRRALNVCGNPPYTELTKYIADNRRSDVFPTLSYFDGVGFAARATAPAWFSVGLMDDIVPPSTVFGAYHAYAGPREMAVWEHSAHEAGGSDDLDIALDAFRTRLLELS